MKFTIDPSIPDPPTYQMGQRGIKTIATSNSPSGRLSFRKQCCLPVCAICVFAVERCGMMRSVDSSPHHPTIPAVHLHRHDPNIAIRIALTGTCAFHVCACGLSSGTAALSSPIGILPVMHQCLREERRDVPREREREPAVGDAELRSFDHG